jgi:hypothetical protein
MSRPQPRCPRSDPDAEALWDGEEGNTALIIDMVTGAQFNSISTHLNRRFLTPAQRADVSLVQLNPLLDPCMCCV